MSMTEKVEGEPLRFVLVDRTPGTDMRFIVQAPSEEVKNEWITQIRSILDMQGDFLRGKFIFMPVMCKYYSKYSFK